MGEITKACFMGEITKAWLVHFKKEPPSGVQASLSIILTLLFSLCLGILASTLTHLLLKKNHEKH
jgi:hypothetical protein